MISTHKEREQNFPLNSFVWHLPFSLNYVLHNRVVWPESVTVDCGTVQYILWRELKAELSEILHLAFYCQRKFHGANKERININTSLGYRRKTLYCTVCTVKCPYLIFRTPPLISDKLNGFTAFLTTGKVIYKYKILKLLN